MPTTDLLFASKLATEYFDPAAGYQVKALCAELGVKPAAFARVTHRKTESVAKLFSGKFVNPKEGETLQVLRQMHQILAVFRAMDWSKDDVARWMNTPLPTDEGRTPLDVLAKGKGQGLVDRLVALATGNVGG
jgi:hypothetical protein